MVNDKHYYDKFMTNVIGELLKFRMRALALSGYDLHSVNCNTTGTLTQYKTSVNG